MDSLAEVMSIYQGSDGEATKTLYARLEQLGPIGVVATNLFRAQKASARAKVYRGGVRGSGSYKDMAYDRKAWAIENLCRALNEVGTWAPPVAAVMAADAGPTVAGVAMGEGSPRLTWGWGVDPKQEVHQHVLYVDLPTGQVSFHTGSRGSGPDYPGEWDGVKDASAVRIMRWIAQVLDAHAAHAGDAVPADWVTWDDGICPSCGQPVTETSDITGLHPECPLRGAAR